MSYKERKRQRGGKRERGGERERGREGERVTERERGQMTHTAAGGPIATSTAVRIQATCSSSVVPAYS